MADGTNNARANQEPSQPSPYLENLLGGLVGTRGISGEGRGRVGFEWMEGGSFPDQRVDLDKLGQGIMGLEIIGPDPSVEIQSRFYFNTGDTLDYAYGPEGNARRSWLCLRGGARS